MDINQEFGQFVETMVDKRTAELQAKTDEKIAALEAKLNRHEEEIASLHRKIGFQKDRIEAVEDANDNLRVQVDNLTKAVVTLKDYVMKAIDIGMKLCFRSTEDRKFNMLDLRDEFFDYMRNQ